jgi:hypothetical protein
VRRCAERAARASPTPLGAHLCYASNIAKRKAPLKQDKALSRSLAIASPGARSIGDQPPGVRDYARPIDRRHGMKGCQRHELLSGDVVLADDLTGKGHTTRSVGVPRISATVPVAT